MTPAGGLDADLALGGESALAHEHDEAARAVAALLDLAAVGVEDAVAEVGVRGVGRSTTSTWSQPTPKRRSASARIVRRVEREAAGATPSMTTKSLPTPCIFVNEDAGHFASVRPASPSSPPR